MESKGPIEGAWIIEKEFDVVDAAVENILHFVPAPLLINENTRQSLSAGTALYSLRNSPTAEYIGANPNSQDQQ